MKPDRKRVSNSPWFIGISKNEKSHFCICSLIKLNTIKGKFLHMHPLQSFRKQAKTFILKILSFHPFHRSSFHSIKINVSLIELQRLPCWWWWWWKKFAPEQKASGWVERKIEKWRRVKSMVKFIRDVEKCMQTWHFIATLLPSTPFLPYLFKYKANACWIQFQWNSFHFSHKRTFSRRVERKTFKCKHKKEDCKIVFQGLIIVWIVVINTEERRSRPYR